MANRTDPIGDKYYAPVRWAEILSEILFYVTAALSLAALIVNRTTSPLLFDIVQTGFILAVVVGGLIAFATRLYLSPQATRKRRQDLLSNSFAVPLTHEKSDGYYNNDQTHPLRRLAASTMESAFFTGAILRAMLVLERAKILAYIVLFLIAITWRTTDLSILAIAAQVLFGEQTLSRYLRMEWLRARSDRVFEHLHSLFTGRNAISAPATQARIVEHYSDYETSKANADVFLSQRIFRKLNSALSTDWDRIRAELSI